MIAGLRDLGKTIFLTTHYMEEAEYLADRIAVIVRGRIVAEGTPDDLGGRSMKGSKVRFTLPAPLTTSDLPPAVRPSVKEIEDGKIEVEASSPLPLLGALAGWAAERGIDLPDLEVYRPTLEDVYLELTKDVR